MPLKSGIGMLLTLCATLAGLPANGSTLIDPTRPARTHRFSPGPGGAHSGWTLDSTLVAPDRRVAVINGKRASEGESVDGARVIEIHKLDVLIRADGKRMTLQLLPDIVKKQP